MWMSEGGGPLRWIFFYFIILLKNLDMWRRDGRQCGLLYFLSLFKGIFGLFDTYLVVFGLFLPKREHKILNTLRKKKKYIHIVMSKCE